MVNSLLKGFDQESIICTNVTMSFSQYLGTSVE